jgi:hypothetical protein
MDAPPYRRMLAEIERRLDALPLLRAPGSPPGSPP